MNASALEGALRALGIPCVVEGRDGLALVVPRDGVEALAERELRRAVVRMARYYGFTHVAVEAIERGSDGVPGAGSGVPTAADRAALHRD